MATKRYVLYVQSFEESALLYPWMKSQTHVQPVKALPKIPEWLQSLSLPVLVDRQKQVAFWGPEELESAMNARKPASKFSSAATLDEL